MMSTEPPKYVAYIDESGCSGDKYGNGSSHFLAIGAIVFAVSDEARILSLFDKAREERCHTRKFQKFSNNKEKDNFVLTRLIGREPVRIAQVALHKPSMAGTYIRSNHQEEYQYLVKFAIERISWIARDAARGENHKVKLIFSEQKMYPYEELASYLNKLKDGRGRFNCSAEWQFIHEEFTSDKHADETGLHLADLVASSLHMAVEPKQHDMIDDRFERNLIPVIYRKHGRAFGFKMFPPREIGQMKNQGHYAFTKLIS